MLPDFNLPQINKTTRMQIMRVLLPVELNVK